MLIRKCDVCGLEIDTKEMFYEIREFIPHCMPTTKAEICIHCAKRILKKEKGNDSEMHTID